MLFGVVSDGRLLLKLLEHTHERRQNGIITAAYQMRECLSEMHGRLLEVVVRYTSKHVVHLMGPDAVDDVMNNSVVAVDGGQLAAHEVPPFVRVPWCLDLVVVKERHNDDVGAENQQWNAIVDH